jgi:hypothetical protein
MNHVVIKVSKTNTDVVKDETTLDLVLLEAKMEAVVRGIELIDPQLHPCLPEVYAVTAAPLEKLMDWFFEVSHRPNKIYPAGTLLLYSDVPESKRRLVSSPDHVITVAIPPMESVPRKGHVMVPMFDGDELKEFEAFKLTRTHRDDADVVFMPGSAVFVYGEDKGQIEIVAADSAENGEFFLYWMGESFQSDDIEALERLLFVRVKRDVGL